VGILHKKKKKRIIWKFSEIKSIRICLKKCFHREKKDKEKKT